MSRIILPRAVTIDPRRLGPWLLALAVCTTFALQPNLYPSRVAPIDTPPKDSTPAEVAPQESPTPPPPISAEQFGAPVASIVLPAESVPDDVTQPADPGVAISEASGAVLAAGGAMARTMTAQAQSTRPGARTVQQLLAVPHIVANLSATLKARAAVRPVNRLAQNHPALPAAKTQANPVLSLMPSALAASGLSGTTMARSVPRPGTLGGPGPFARKVVVSIGGVQTRGHY